MTTTLAEFADRQSFEVEATANLLRLKRRLHASSDWTLALLFSERKRSEKYSRFLKNVSWNEINHELDHPGAFRELVTGKERP